MPLSDALAVQAEAGVQRVRHRICQSSLQMSEASKIVADLPSRPHDHVAARVSFSDRQDKRGDKMRERKIFLVCFLPPFFHLIIVKVAQIACRKISSSTHQLFLSSSINVCKLQFHTHSSIVAFRLFSLRQAAACGERGGAETSASAAGAAGAAGAAAVTSSMAGAAALGGSRAASSEVSTPRHILLHHHQW